MEKYIVLIMATLALAACSVQTGKPESEYSWIEPKDRNP